MPQPTNDCLPITIIISKGVPIAGRMNRIGIQFHGLYSDQYVVENTPFTVHLGVHSKAQSQGYVPCTGALQTSFPLYISVVWKEDDDNSCNLLK